MSCRLQLVRPKGVLIHLNLVGVCNLQIGWRQETAKNPFSRQPEMVPAALHYSGLQHQLLSAINHHHSTRDVMYDNAPSRQTNVPAYSPSSPQPFQQMPQSQFSGSHHYTSHDSNKTITKDGHSLAAPSFHSQHSQNMQDRNQHGVWMGYGPNNNSPSRHQDRTQGHGRNYPEQGVNPGWVQGRPERGRRQDLPGFRDHSSWNGGRKYGNQDRRR